MKLSEHEFNLIRPLQWTLVNHGSKVYNTTANPTQTRLFWFDFMRQIFAPKFKKQYGITRVDNFDSTQPVLLTDDLELRLPTQIETICYFANNMDTLPMKFSTHITKRLTLIIAIILIILIIGCDIIFGERLPLKHII
ncbi:Ac68-like protein [Drosophila innubila nudivirus]|uniref:Ac68-like protein n=1 Tax=Drosophila innubila nudivirus TaxID=2057187 RepID=A0A2H4UX73_9VIRU|nr:Ac68-like protein [Drosophila innubila nudivirus]ATZ81517.1 Ac68-like protein [Drosophila innubila nudivirus]